MTLRGRFLIKLRSVTCCVINFVKGSPRLVFHIFEAVLAHILGIFWPVMEDATEGPSGLSVFLQNKTFCSIFSYI